MTEVVIVLNSDEAVKAFSRGGNVTVGGGLWVSRDSEIEADRQVVYQQLLDLLEPEDRSLRPLQTQLQCSVTPGQRVCLSFLEYVSSDSQVCSQV